MTIYILVIVEVKTCSSCNRLKDVNVFSGFKTCDACREKHRASHHRNYDKHKDKRNEQKREKRANESTYCPNCGQNVRDEHWEEHLNWFRHKGSELNLLYQDFQKNYFGSKFSKEEQEQARQEYHRKKKYIYDKLNEKYPNGKWIIQNE